VTYQGLSLWHDSCGDDLVPRAPLTGDTDVDVAIVGAGFTGLWTAYYLAVADPTLRIAIVERDIAGFGASGRNGGWASAFFPTSRARVARLPGSSRDAANRMATALRDSIAEIDRVTTAEHIDCDYHRGGTISFARSRSQLARAKAEVADARSWGDSEDDVRLLSAAEASQVAAASRMLGATYSPHCARIHPAKLVRGLARAVEAYGVMIYEQTTAMSIAPSVVTTSYGSVRAEYVVRATEGYTPTLRGHARDIAPVYSLIVATEPLSPDVWAEIGLAENPTFTDQRHVIIYGQRTADDRLVFGGRGAPYHYASSISPAFDREDRVFAGLRTTLLDLFPQLRGTAASDNAEAARFTHAWGGPLGVPRDWMPSVSVDHTTGIGWAGGYVGDGVSTTNLAGRTLADLIVGAESDLTQLPWVGHRSRRWEPEPLRWLGVNAGLRAMTLADREELRTGRPSLVAKAMGPLLGGH
jgi:glycine/D-amino acid oxidase-like deaminating enzyme